MDVSSGSSFSGNVVIWKGLLEWNYFFDTNCGRFGCLFPLKFYVFPQPDFIWIIYLKGQTLHSQQGMRFFDG